MMLLVARYLWPTRATKVTLAAELKPMVSTLCAAKVCNWSEADRMSATRHFNFDQERKNGRGGTLALNTLFTVLSFCCTAEL